MNTRCLLYCVLKIVSMPLGARNKLDCFELTTIIDEIKTPENRNDMSKPVFVFRHTKFYAYTLTICVFLKEKRKDRGRMIRRVH